jgi:hypothetical protein
MHCVCQGGCAGSVQQRCNVAPSVGRAVALKTLSQPGFWGSATVQRHFHGTPLDTHTLSLCFLKPLLINRAHHSTLSCGGIYLSFYCCTVALLLKARPPLEKRCNAIVQRLPPCNASSRCTNPWWAIGSIRHAPNYDHLRHLEAQHHRHTPGS